MLNWIHPKGVEEKIMGSQFKNDSGVITTKGSFRQTLIIPVWLAVIVLLTATCGNSKTVSPDDESPHSTTAPLTSVAGASPALRPAGEPPEANMLDLADSLLKMDSQMFK